MDRISWLSGRSSAGLLEHRPHGEDRRLHSLFLTDRGRAPMNRLNDEVVREMGEEARAL